MRGPGGWFVGALFAAACTPGSVPDDAAGGDAARVEAGMADHTAADRAAVDAWRVDQLATDAALPDRGGAAESGVADRESNDAGALCPEPACTVVGGFPYQHSDDTTASPRDQFDLYSCGAQSESGPEHVYAVTLTNPGTLIAMLDDGSSVGADVDVHLLSALDPQACLRRGHLGLSAHLAAGTYYLVVDTWADSGGTEYPGPYTLYVHVLVDGTTCAMQGGELARIGDSQPLPMPATGRVVLEAHLVTDQEFSGGSWPQSLTDGIPAHYALSESVTGYSMSRTEPWAPCCEPSNEYGQGSSVRPPVGAEAFYLNMRWASAPPRGQRYIVFNGITGAAVVAAAGYENGPGDLTRIGGACEEIHDHLDTAHLDVLTFGVAVDQGLPYGPIDCGG